MLALRPLALACARRRPPAHPSPAPGPGAFANVRFPPLVGIQRRLGTEPAMAQKTNPPTAPRTNVTDTKRNSSNQPKTVRTPLETVSLSSTDAWSGPPKIPIASQGMAATIPPANAQAKADG